MYSQLVARFIFPAHEFVKGHQSVALRKALEQSQWWDPERLQAQQLEKLRMLLERVGQRVPYYRRLFRALGFHPADLIDVAGLERLPFLTKDVIRTHLEDLKAEDARRLTRYNTGGSSGNPLVFFIGRGRSSYDTAAKWRATRWWGVDIGDPEIVVWGSPIELGAQDWVRALRDKLLRTRLLPAFEMSDHNLDRFVAEIRAMQPRMLFGYPSALSHIAQHARRRGQKMDHLGVKVAFVTGETLYDEQRDLITEVFACPVANGYGGRDAGFIAHQCPAGGMHISAEDIIVEIVDGSGRVLPPGQAGEIVVTNLATADFPFIRYKIGDVGVLGTETCSCGRGLPLIKEIQGRTTDFVVAADGTVMHGLALIYILRDMPGLESFKIIQESLQRIRVLLVTTDLSPELQTRIRGGFQQRLGDQVKVEIEQVETIPGEGSGKFRYVVSKVTDTTARV